MATETTTGMDDVIVPQEAWNKLREAVAFETLEDKQKFLVDAMNTYVQLGQFVQSGYLVLLKRPEGTIPPKDYVNLVFPFQSPAHGMAEPHDTSAD